MRRVSFFAATGDSGIIYKITGPGKASVFYDSEEEHIRLLQFDKKGNLLAGSVGQDCYTKYRRVAKDSCCTIRRIAKFIRSLSTPTARFSSARLAKKRHGFPCGKRLEPPNHPSSQMRRKMANRN